MKTRSKYKKMKEKKQKMPTSIKEVEEFSFENSMEELTHHPYITIIGQRFSGKSVLIAELVYHLDKKFKYDNIFCFSQTAKMSGSFSFMRQDCIFDTLDNLKKIVEIRKKSQSKSPTLLLFDDIAGMTSQGANGKRKNIRYNETLEFLSTTARHFNFSIILSIQNRVLCSKTCRNNSSFSFIFTPKSHDDTTCIKNEYLGLCRSKEESNALFDSVYGTAFKSLVVEGWKSGVIDIYDYVKWYIAPYPERKFKTKSLRTHKRNQAKEKKRKKKKEYEPYSDLNIFADENEEEKLNFRLTNIYNEKVLRKEQDNPYEKAINIY